MDFRFTADEELGRVYTLPVYIGNTIAGFLTVTIAGWDPQSRRVRLHSDDGGKSWISMDEFRALVDGGQMKEAPMAAPFVND